MHVIHIDPATGRDHSDCLTSNDPSSPCANLTWVFQQDRSDSTHYVLSEGSHYLTEPTPNFQGLTSLAFTGTGSVIICTDSDSGLAFIDVEDMTFHDIAFLNCSALRNSTSKNFADDTISEFYVGLYFYLCENINMSRISVSHSPNAIGVVVYDTNGTNTISESNFTNNILEKNNMSYPGGGGFYVEFTYCKPGVLVCDTPTSNRNKGAVFMFKGCEFSHNQANNTGANKDNFTYIFPYKETHQSLGRGGGLGFYARGTASGIRFTVDGCAFRSNRALWGAGVLIEMHDSTYGNVVNIRHSSFEDNMCPFSASGGTGGGGLRLAHYVYGMESMPGNATGNKYIVDSCTFTDNSALNGGGLSVSWALQNVYTVEQLLFVLISNSTFRSNLAKLGSGIHVDQFWMVSLGLSSKVWIDSCQFDNNSNSYLRKDVSIIPFQLGFGTVCVSSSDVSFKNSVSFTNNIGGSLAVTSGNVNFNGTSAKFENNHGNDGGGIILVGASTIEVGHGTKMLFKNNSADVTGGAIRVIQYSREFLQTDAKCFVRHIDPSLITEEWNITMQFIDNWDHKRLLRNAISATTILPCSLVGGNNIITNMSKVLCWEGWEYYNSSEREPAKCQSQISTGIGSMEYLDYNVSAFPGWDFTIPVRSKDDLDNDISNKVVFYSQISGTELSIINGGVASVNGKENHTLNMTVKNYGENLWSAEVLVNLLTCPPGFKYSNSSGGTCICASTYGGFMLCNLKAKEARLAPNIWMGLFDGSYYITGCPPHHCSNTKLVLGQYPKLTNKSKNLDSLCVPKRTGVMCGECVKGLGPAVNSKTFECVNCTGINLAANIALYLSSVYLPLAVLFIILIVFDIRLTTGPANAFILYCQVVSGTFSLDADGQLPLDKIVKDITKAYTSLYGVFNLEFIENYLPPICFSTKFSTLTVLCLDYCVAFFPLIMIGIVLAFFKVKEYCAAKLRSNSGRFVRKKSRTISESILPAFASFLLLSYTKFSTVSAYIVTTHSLLDENGKHHDKLNRVYLAGQYSSHDATYRQFYIIAILMFCTFVLFPPLLLLEYPLRAFEYALSKSDLLSRLYPTDKIHILLDTFQGCYRNKRRFFVGLYFLFRLSINISYIFSKTWLVQFVIQQVACSVMVLLITLCQPYKRKFLNYVDILIFTNLGVLNCLSLYLFEMFKNQHLDPLKSVFVVQYVLVFLPLVYMLVYIVWQKTEKYHARIRRAVLYRILRYRASFPKQLDTVVRDNLSISSPGDDNTEYPSPYGDGLDDLFIRSKSSNTYKSTFGFGGHVPVTVVGVKYDGGVSGEASVQHILNPADSSSCGEEDPMVSDGGSGTRLTGTRTRSSGGSRTRCSSGYVYGSTGRTSTLSRSMSSCNDDRMDSK